MEAIHERRNSVESTLSERHELTEGFVQTMKSSFFSLFHLNGIKDAMEARRIELEPHVIAQISQEAER